MLVLQNVESTHLKTRTNMIPHSLNVLLTGISGALTGTLLLYRHRGVVLGRNGNRDYTVRRMNCLDKRTVLLRTSAIRVVNPDTGLSTFAYAQHDTGSQVTLISNNLRKELGLYTTPDPTVTIRTLADRRVITERRTDFNLKSLIIG